MQYLLKAFATVVLLVACGVVQAQDTGKFKAAGIMFLPSGAANEPSPFANAAVDGVVLRTSWSETESVDNTYNFELIDRYLDGAASSGKVFGLAISAGIRTPAWFFKTNAVTIKVTHADPGTGQETLVSMPVPWDITFQRKWENLIKTVADRYDTQPNLAYVTIGGVGKAYEPLIAKTATDLKTFDAMGGLAKWVEGAKAVIDIYARHFKKTPFILTMHYPVPTAQGLVAIQEVVDYGLKTYPRRFGVKYDGLDAKASTTDYFHRMISTSGRGRSLGYQMIWSSVGVNADWLKGSLGDVLQKAVEMKADFVEVYSVDCNNSAYQAVLKEKGAALRANSTR